MSKEFEDAEIIEDINSENFKKRNKEDVRSLLYIFFFWMSLLILLCILVKWSGGKIIEEPLDWILLFLIPTIPTLFVAQPIIRWVKKETILTDFYYNWVYYSTTCFLLLLWFYGAADTESLVMYGLITLVAGWALSVTTKMLYVGFARKEFLGTESGNIGSFIYSILVWIAGLITKPFRKKNNQWDFRKIGAIVLIISAVTVAFQHQKKRIDPSVRCGIDSINNAIRGVVSITGSEGDGSGFMIYPNIILTNNHVISFNDDLRVKDYSGKTVTAKIIATDTVRDLAVLEVDGLYSAQLLWRTDPIGRLYDVYAVGFPTDGKDVSITKGIISALTKDEYNNNQYIQTDAAINPGNSGGPLLDECGKVVGINTASLRDAQNIGFAIRADNIEAHIADMINLSKLDSKEEVNNSYPSNQAEVVAKYYDALSNGRLDIAYDFYSAGRKNKTPLENWKKGFEDTYFIILRKVEATPIQNTVFASFVVTDYGAEPFTFETKEFEGRWKLVHEGGLWKLDESQINEVSPGSDEPR